MMNPREKKMQFVHGEEKARLASDPDRRYMNVDFSFLEPKYPILPEEKQKEFRRLCQEGIKK